MEGADGDEVVDIDQQEYLAELESNSGEQDDEILFEDDASHDSFTIDEANENFTHFKEIIRYITLLLTEIRVPLNQKYDTLIARLVKEHNLLFKRQVSSDEIWESNLTQVGCMGTLVSLDSVYNKLSKSNSLESFNENDVVFTIHETLLSTNELSVLQLILEILDQLTTKEYSQMVCIKDSLSEVLMWFLPLFKPNKLFIKTLKVGNMKQKIDEGTPLRVMLYTVLLKCANRMNYKASCEVLKQATKYGLKDRDDGIREKQALSLIRNIIEHHYTTFLGIDEEWYRSEIVDGLLKMAEKLGFDSPSASLLLSLVRKFPPRIQD